MHNPTERDDQYQGLDGLVRAAFLALVSVVVVSACGGGSTPVSAPLPTHSPAGLRPAAAEALLKSSVAAVVSGTAQYRQVVTISTSTETVRTEQQGSLDGRRHVWQSTLTGDAGGAPVGTIRFVVTAQALYLTSPGWPTSMRGRWYRFTPRDLAGAAGGFAQGATIGALPDAADVLLSARATAARTAPTGTNIDAEIPASKALALAGLRGGLSKLRVDPASITGVVRLRVELGPGGDLQSAQIAPGSLARLAPQLPQAIQEATQQLGVVIRFSHVGEPVTITVPASSDIIPGSQSHP